MKLSLSRFIGTGAVSVGIGSMNAQAQFIEINASVFGAMDQHGSFRMVLDTREPPKVENDGNLFFKAVRATTFTRNRLGGPHAFDVAEPDRAFDDEIDKAGIFIEQSTGSVFMYVEKPMDLSGVSPIRWQGVHLEFSSLTADLPIPALNSEIESLPDDPADYAFAGGEDVYIGAQVNESHTIASYTESKLGTNVGSIFYTVGRVTDPNANPCSPADINEDGSLDFWDAMLFTLAYAAERQIADINDDGEYDFADLSAFLAAFRDGCQE